MCVSGSKVFPERIVGEKDEHLFFINLDRISPFRRVPREKQGESLSAIRPLGFFPMS